MSEFSADQKNRMESFIASRRSYLYQNQTTSVVYDKSVAANESVKLFGSRFTFSSNKSLVVNGRLDASGTTFTASNPAQGWGGIRFEPGSSGTLDGTTQIPTVVERVAGSAAVTVRDAAVTLRNTLVQNNNLTTGTIGLWINGSNRSANVLVENSRIQDNSGQGIYASLGSARLIGTTVARSVEQGTHVVAPADVITLHTSSVLDNGSTGVWSVWSGRTTFVDPVLGQPQARNNTLTGNGGSLRVNAGGRIAAGTATTARNNVLTARAGTRDIDVADYGTIGAQYNYWDGGPPATVHGPASSITFTPYCTVLPEQGCNPAAARGVAGSGDDPLWEAYEAGDAGDTAGAFARLRAVIEAEDGATERSASAYTEAVGLLAGADAPLAAEAAAWLDGRAATAAPDERAWALRAAWAAHVGQGETSAARATAEALVAEYGGTDHAVFGAMALFDVAMAEGDTVAAVAALDGAEAELAPVAASRASRRAPGDDALEADAAVSGWASVVAGSRLGLAEAGRATPSGGHHGGEACRCAGAGRGGRALGASPEPGARPVAGAARARRSGAGRGGALRRAGSPRGDGVRWRAHRRGAPSGGRGVGAAARCVRRAGVGAVGERGAGRADDAPGGGPVTRRHA